ncbi:MAG: MBL fold metallo-hydrolase [Coriobacteriales bacterium]|nr:MBL fold metallo-hydrolase [Coriobacteriales bacterium]
MDNYHIQQIDDETWQITDAGDATWYVAEGAERAAVIDTGVIEGAHIMPVVRALTDKPAVLLITHAHFDHMYHADEFETRYMSHREFEMPAWVLDSFTQGRADLLRSAIDIRTGSRIDLGGRALEVCEVAGHTPGSVVFFDKSHQQLFCGDCMGSGIGVWMQLPGVTSFGEYRDALSGLAAWLTERGGRMSFLVGHANQPFMSELPGGYNPPSMGMLWDMIDLVSGIMAGRITGRPSNAPVLFTHRQALRASFGRAQIEYVADWVEDGSF